MDFTAALVIIIFMLLIYIFSPAFLFAASTLPTGNRIGDVYPLIRLGEGLTLSEGCKVGPQPLPSGWTPQENSNGPTVYANGKVLGRAHDDSLIAFCSGGKFRDVVKVSAFKNDKDSDVVYHIWFDDSEKVKSFARCKREGARTKDCAFATPEYCNHLADRTQATSLDDLSQKVASCKRLVEDKLQAGNTDAKDKTDLAFSSLTRAERQTNEILGSLKEGSVSRQINEFISYQFGNTPLGYERTSQRLETSPDDPLKETKADDPKFKRMANVVDDLSRKDMIAGVNLCEAFSNAMQDTFKTNRENLQKALEKRANRRATDPTLYSIPKLPTAADPKQTK